MSARHREFKGRGQHFVKHARANAVGTKLSSSMY